MIFIILGQISTLSLSLGKFLLVVIFRKYVKLFYHISYFFFSNFPYRNLGFSGATGSYKSSILLKKLW